MENPVKMDDLRVKPTIFGNIHIGGCGFTYLFGIFTPIYMGKGSILTNGFSNGLKPPTSLFQHISTFFFRDKKFVERVANRYV